MTTGAACSYDIYKEYINPKVRLALYLYCSPHSCIAAYFCVSWELPDHPAAAWQLVLLHGC